MGLTITDTLALVTKGYKVSDISDLKTILETNDDNNIIELAKKLGPDDFKAAMALFSAKPKQLSEGQEENEDSKVSEGGEESAPEDKGNEPKEDDVDYKELYTKEKSMREKLQQDNANRTVKNDDTRSDEEIALQVAMDVLN